MRIKSKTLTLVLCCVIFAAFAQPAIQSGSKIVTEALKRESAIDAIAYLDTAVKGPLTAQEKRDAYILRAHIQEQLGLHVQAAASYLLAVSLEEHEQNTHLKLLAAFCCLSAGETKQAADLVNSVLLTASDQNTLSKARLYALWVDLCKEQSEKRFTEITNTLQSFLYNPIMKNIRVSVLFTLWWLTDDSKFAAQLKTEFPQSPETAIAQGKSHILPAPFCYFVPRIAATRAASAP